LNLNFVIPVQATIEFSLLKDGMKMTVQHKYIFITYFYFKR